MAANAVEVSWTCRIRYHLELCLYAREREHRQRGRSVCLGRTSTDKVGLAGWLGAVPYARWVDARVLDSSQRQSGLRGCPKPLLLLLLL